MAQQYLDEIVIPEVVSAMQANDDIIFQQDNAKPHTARLTVEYLVDILKQKSETLSDIMCTRWMVCQV